MKKILSVGAFALFVALIYSFTIVSSTPPTTTEVGGDMKWYTWEEAVAANEKEKRKIFVDVYTDWCGWCKRMDKSTFSDKDVIDYVNKNFYAVKLDAEQKGDITFQGHTFKWQAGGRRGVHQLAGSLLEGKMSYPSVVYLTGDFERISISPGYKDAKQFLDELTWVVDEKYK